MKELVLANVYKTLARVKALAPIVPPEDTLPSGPVSQGVMELITAATNMNNLCRMEPTWHPWF